jgi:hypothetical protein
VEQIVGYICVIDVDSFGGRTHNYVCHSKGTVGQEPGVSEDVVAWQGREGGGDRPIVKGAGRE